MYPGCEFVAGGQKVKKGVLTIDIVSAVEVRSCYLDLFLLIQELSTDQTVISAAANIHFSDVGMNLKVQYVRIGSQTTPNKLLAACHQSNC